MSTSLSSNLEILVLKYSNWNNYASISQYPIWELREAISFLDIQIIESELTSKQISNINTIVSHVLRSSAYTWQELTLLEEALIQSHLRNKSVSIKCADLNKFPTSVQELQSFLEINKTENYKRYFGKSLTFIAQYKMGMIFYFTIAYILLNFNIHYFLIAALAAWMLHFILQIAEHDYFSHRYIVPKNRYLEQIFIFIMRFSLGNPEYFRASHLHHHYYWNQKEDILDHLIRSGKWWHLLGCTSYNLTYGHDIAATVKHKGEVKLNSWFSKFMAKNYRYVLTTICLLTWAVFGLDSVVYFCFIPMLAHLIGGALPDALMYIFKQQSNFPFMYPIMMRDAYHYDHHVKWLIKEFDSIDDLFSNQGWLKYLSFEYYFMKLFFKFNKVGRSDPAFL